MGRPSCVRYRISPRPHAIARVQLGLLASQHPHEALVMRRVDEEAHQQRERPVRRPEGDRSDGQRRRRRDLAGHHVLGDRDREQADDDDHEEVAPVVGEQRHRRRWRAPCPSARSGGA